MKRHQAPARAARWHVLDRKGRPLADLYARSVTLARRAAAKIAESLKAGVVLVGHGDLARTLKAHPAIRVSARPPRARTAPASAARRGRGPRSSSRPARRTRKNPDAASLAQAGKTYVKWHGFGHAKVKHVQVPKPPRGLVKLGEVVRIDYVSNKWGGRRRRYTHATKRPYPVLATGTDGKDVLLVGGRMKVTERGLVD